MSIVNKIKIISNILQTRITGSPIPIVVHINVTNRCNLRCSYCYGTYFDKKKRDFTTNELVSLIDEVGDLGTKIINLGAGEPLLRKDIETIIDKVRSRGIECRMNTNGHLVPGKLSAVKKLNSLCISIDGDEEAHDRFKGKGSFKRVLEAIDCAQQNKIRVHTSTVLTKFNVHTVDFLADLGKNMGFFVEFLLPFFQMPEEFIASEEEYHAALKKIITYKRRGYRIFFSEKVHRYALDWPDYRQKSFWYEVPDGFKHIHCHAGRNMCIIDADGKLYPCSQMIGGYPALNVLEHGFKKSWEHLWGHGCKTCYAFVCFNEYNLLMNFDPSVIWNQVKNTLAYRDH